MKKILLFSILVGVLFLTACNRADDPSVIRVGATPSPHAEILEFVKPLLAEKGYTLQIRTFTDYIMPNRALTNKDLHANYFQHIPYLTNYNAQNKSNIVSVGGVHFEPIGIYATDPNLKKLKDLPNNATIIMSNSVTDQGRLLGILQENGLIKLREDVELANARITDIVENPKNLTIINNIAPEFLVRSFNNKEADLVLINGNYVLAHRLSESYRIASESQENASRFINVVAVNKGFEDDPRIQALIEVLQSDAVFIEENFFGAVVAAN